MHITPAHQGFVSGVVRPDCYRGCYQPEAPMPLFSRRSEIGWRPRGTLRTSESGNHVREASWDDAWLAVRVAGALILRLAAGRKR
jgi:hypothetical protein